MSVIELCWSEPSAVVSSSFLNQKSYNIVMNTTAGRFDPNFCNAAISTTLTNRIYLDCKSDQTDIWLHFDMYSNIVTTPEVGTTPVNGIPSIIFHSSSGDEQFRFTIGDSNTSWYLLKTLDGVTWTVIDTVSTLTNSIRHVLDLHIKISSTVGRYELFQNGTQLRNFTGDTSCFNNSIRYVTMGSGSVNVKDYSQIILANENTVNWKVASLSLTADGGVTNWSNTFAQVNSVTYTSNKSFGLHTNSLSSNHSFVASDINVAATGLTVDSVWAGYRGSITTDSSVQGIYPLIRSGGVNYVNSTKIMGITDCDEVVNKAKWSANPVNGSGWTQADVNSFEYGVNGGL
jgi:hypothetical protein